MVTNKEVQDHIANEFYALRLELDLNQRELGEKLGISQTRISDFENGRIKFSASTLFLFCAKLGVDVNRFNLPAIQAERKSVEV